MGGDPGRAPVVNALIAKAHKGKDAALEMMGTGAAERQIMFARDLAKVMIWATFHFDETEPLLVAGEEVSIKFLAETISTVMGLSKDPVFDGDANKDGPQKRTADTSRFHKMCK